MANNQRYPGPIPERWLHCPRKASGLLANKFLAFKTPLSEKYDSQVPEDCRFNPKTLFDVAKSYKWKIGLWIDLTFTKRFYDKEDIIKLGAKYLKFQCRGHGGPPNAEQTQAFIEVCHRFISQQPLEIIGVHCTHGFNRTGFLIVSYLVEKLDVALDAGLLLFKRARPPGIYKADYLAELYKRYEDDSSPPVAPPLPDWCTEHNDEDYGKTEVEEKTAGRPRKKEFRKKNPVFMAGVPNVIPVTDSDLLSRIQMNVQKMCKWKGDGFPGCQPVSMNLKNLTFLQTCPYKVSWKADGTRYMMLVLKEKEVYFVDRDNSVFEVSGMHFPHSKDRNRHLKDTLLDGEMVIDKVEGRNIPRYLAYDIVSYEGVNVGCERFDTRLKYIVEEIVKPRRIAMAGGRINRDLEPFSVRLKNFWDITQTESLLSDKFAKTLSHEPDGLIFQPALDPYHPGVCKEVLKWKPRSHNSVDFTLKKEREGGEGIVPCFIGNLYVGGLDRPFAKMKWRKSMNDLDNKIIECKLENNQWVFMRERTDKSFPNGFETAQSVMNSILNPVTQEILVDFIQNRRFRLEDQDLMPPPAKVPRR